MIVRKYTWTFVPTLCNDDIMEIEDFILLRDHLWNLRYEYMKERRSNDGLRSHYLYQTWMMMLNRCYNPNSVSFPNYGARGIDVCDRWLSLKDFVSDIGNGEGLTLDRKDNDRGYSSDNCRWTTKTEQANNKREDKKKEAKERMNKLINYRRSPRIAHIPALGGLR